MRQEELSSVLTQIGLKLKNHRMAKKLSIEEVADYVKIRTQQVEYLENGQLDLLPQFVFTRNFIRKYAEFLGIEKEILPLLNTVGEPTKTIVQNNFQISVLDTFINIIHRYRWSIYLIILAVILGVIFLWQRHSINNTTRQSHIFSEQITAPISQQFVHENSVIIPLVVSDSVREIKENVEDDDDILHIYAKYRTSLYVKDSTGKKLIHQIVSGGSHHQLHGKPPYEIRLGYAKDSVIELNSKKYTIEANKNNRNVSLIVP